MMFKRKLVKTFRKSEMCYVNKLDCANPVAITRFADVDVYRLPWDFFGFADIEIETWSDWHEIADVIFGKTRPRIDKIFGELLAKDMAMRNEQ